MSSPAQHVPVSAAQAETRPLRFVTAASLFDGHDAAINIMRRIIQAQGAEVIHLGHNRSVEDVVRAALQEDADAIALSVLPGRPRRVLQVHGRHAEGARRRAHPRVRRRRRHHHAGRDRASCRPMAWSASTTPTTA